MGKKEPKQPPAPDPVAVAAAQTKSNIETANANAHLNRIDQYNPWGSQVYNETKNPDGTTKWSQTTTLDPAQQKLLDSSNRISQSMSDLGESQLGRVGDSMSQQLTYDRLPNQVNSVSYGKIQDDVNMAGVPKLIGGADLTKDLQTQRDALYKQQSAFMDPQWKQDQGDLENKLVQQGVMQNSDAWNRAIGDFSRNKEFAYNNARQSAITGGGAEQSRLFGIGLASNQNAYSQALNNAQFHNTAQAQGFGQAMSNANLTNQGRSQGINEANYLRQQPLNELNALRTGSQVTAPQFGQTQQTNQAGTDVSGITQQGYQNSLNPYNAQIAQNNAMTSGLFGLGAAALISDRRLKRDIRQIGMHPVGIPLYSYNYVWGEPGVGVMADELEKVRPNAVLSHHPSGYKMVNYEAI